MSSEEIYSTYLSLAFESNKSLIAYHKFALKAAPTAHLKELQYYSRSISFFYSKLINMLSNQKLWNNCTDLTTLPVYLRDHSKVTLNDELTFLRDNKEGIQCRLDFIKDKRLFDIDLKFIATTLERLKVAANRLRGKLQPAEQEFTYYSIAS